MAQLSVRKAIQSGNKRHRGVYFLPNLLTSCSLFFGFYAIVMAMKGSFDHAGIAVYMAMLMDALDGRVARLTNTQTPFGSQYDSLSDMVSFGLAPAIIAYHWGLLQLGKPGWLIAFLYVATTALRLARFNVQTTTTVDKRYFRGLPCPTSAGMIAGGLWVAQRFTSSQQHNTFILITVAVLLPILSLLMVSHFRYPSFKQIDFRRKVPILYVFIIVLMLTFFAIDPPMLLLITLSTYAFSAPFWVAWNLLFHRKR